MQLLSNFITHDNFYSVWHYSATGRNVDITRYFYNTLCCLFTLAVRPLVLLTWRYGTFWVNSRSNQCMHCSEEKLRYSEQHSIQYCSVLGKRPCNNLKGSMKILLYHCNFHPFSGKCSCVQIIIIVSYD